MSDKWIFFVCFILGFKFLFFTFFAFNSFKVLLMVLIDLFDNSIPSCYIHFQSVDAIATSAICIFELQLNPTSLPEMKAQSHLPRRVKVVNKNII